LSIPGFSVHVRLCEREDRNQWKEGLVELHEINVLDKWYIYLMLFVVVTTKNTDGRCEKTDLHLLANNNSIQSMLFKQNICKVLTSTTKNQYKNHIIKLEDCK